MPFIGTRVKNIVLDEDKKRALEKSLGSGDYAAAGEKSAVADGRFRGWGSPVLPGRSPVSGCFLWRSRFLVPWTRQPATG